MSNTPRSRLVAEIPRSRGSVRNVQSVHDHLIASAISLKTRDEDRQSIDVLSDCRASRKMEEEEQGLTRLIGDIYDAALGSSRWPDVLAQIANFVGGQAAGLLSKDAVSKYGNVYYQSGVDPYYVQLYSDEYWKFDPVARLADCEIGHIVSVSDLMSYDEFRAGRFFREWAQPQGWIDAANAVLEKTATNCAYLTVLRNVASGMVDDELRRRMQLIVPHVRRAVRTGRVIDLTQAEAATYADILDGLSPAIFLVDQWAAQRQRPAGRPGVAQCLRCRRQQQRRGNQRQKYRNPASSADRGALCCSRSSVERRRAPQERPGIDRRCGPFCAQGRA